MKYINNNDDFNNFYNLTPKKKFYSHLQKDARNISVHECKTIPCLQVNCIFFL